MTFLLPHLKKKCTRKTSLLSCQNQASGVEGSLTSFWWCILLYCRRAICIILVGGVAIEKSKYHLSSYLDYGGSSSDVPFWTLWIGIKG